MAFRVVHINMSRIAFTFLPAAVSGYPADSQCWMNLLEEAASCDRFVLVGALRDPQKHKDLNDKMCLQSENMSTKAPI